MAPNDGTKRARLRAVRWVLGSIAVVVFAVLVLQEIPAPAGNEFPADANDAAQRKIPNAVEAGSKSGESKRESAASSTMVAITVHDPEGKPLVAEVVSPDLRLTVDGSGWLPATTKTITVAAPGHLSQDVVIEGPRTVVVLQPSRTLLGFVFDAVTRQRIAGASVSVQGAAGAAAVRSLVTDDRGEFAFAGLASGEVFVRSTADGYAPYFVGPSASFPGLQVELHGEHRVEFALFPV